MNVLMLECVSGMKVLQLCYKPPYPPVDGGTMAMNSVTQGLLDCGHAVRVLSVCSDKHPIPPLRDAKDYHEQYAKQTRFEALYIDLSIHPIDAGVALLCGESYNVKRFYSKAFDARLKEILKEEDFDIVHVESIFLAPYLDTIRRNSKARVVLRAHNVEHRIWQQMAKGERRGLKRWYLKHLALALRQYELEQMNNFDGIVCISEDDKEAFRQLGCRKKIISIPFGIDIKHSSTQTFKHSNTQALFHIGSMDWMPNQEGVRWFLGEVWPLIHQEMPQLMFFVAGRKMPDNLCETQRATMGVNVVGEVDDAREFIASKDINIVPLLSGSGMRIKIIEAMSMGKPVVSTTVGASGIEYTDGEDLLIADTPEEFVKQLRRLTEDPEFCNNVGQNARKLVEMKYSQEATAKRLVEFYETLL